MKSKKQIKKAANILFSLSTKAGFSDPKFPTLNNFI